MKNLPSAVEVKQELPDPDAIEMAVLLMRLSPHTRLALYWLVLAISESESLAQLIPGVTRDNLS